MDSIELVGFEAKPRRRISSLSDHVLGVSFTQGNIPNNFWPHIRCFVYASVYVSSSIALVLLNKWLLTRNSFRFPITLVMTQSALVWGFSSAVLFLFKARFISSPHWITRVTRQFIVHSILPLSISTGADVTLTSIAFENLSVEFTEVIKSGIPVLVLIFSILFLKQKLTMEILLTMILLSLGIALTSFGEVNVNTVGVLAAFCAMTCGATKLILTEQFFQSDSRHIKHAIPPLLLLNYNAPLMAAIMFLPFLAFEAQHLFNSPFLASQHSELTILAWIGLGSILVMVHNLMEFYVIRETSALTFTVVGVCKLIILVLLSTIFFSETLTVLNIVGCLVCLLGIFVYKYVHTQQRGGTKMERVNSELDMASISPSLPDQVFAIDNSVSLISDNDSDGIYRER